MAALEALGREAYGDGPVRDAVKARADDHDETYFDAEEAGDDDTAMEQFCLARAVSSLWFAMSADADEAAKQALYEARHSLADADDDALVELIGRELKSTS
jgi:hypothetical protein